MTKQRFILMCLVSFASLWVPFCFPYLASTALNQLGLYFNFDHGDLPSLLILSGLIPSFIVGALTPVYIINFTFSNPGKSWIVKCLPKFVDPPPKPCRLTNGYAVSNGSIPICSCSDLSILEQKRELQSNCINSYKPEEHSWINAVN